jgi:uncharacterized membrane protein YccC
MLIAAAMGKNAYLVALGQGGFFYSSLYLPKNINQRIVLGALILGMGLGFYTLGGNVVEYPVVAVLFTFLVCINLSFLTNWKQGAPLALTLIMIYTAGINSGSAEKAANNFLMFALVLGWSAIISMLPFWKPIEPPEIPPRKDAELGEQGVRMGIGASLALALSYIFSAAKLGWAPSAVGSVVRFDEVLSKKRAYVRVLGTLGGSATAALTLMLVTDVRTILYIGALFAVINGVVKKTVLGMMPLFYTATILVLYSVNDLSSSKVTILARIGLNVAGVLVGLFVVLYPFPYLAKALRKNASD